ncbi:MAG TPA: hypothetical protein VNI84_08835 [Pyrinomonadaceae bacterium]|nr:hypothetical protein [Pyrinomonadaceae bacterium]
MMKILLKAGIAAFAFGLIFTAADTANAQKRGERREARREYRGEIRDARQDRRKEIIDARQDRRRDIRNGENRRKANREFRDERRDANREFRGERREARREYRSDTGRRINRGYYVSRSRRAYPRQQQQRYRVYYRNGRRYTVRY